MALVDVKPYLRTVMDNLSYVEWTDGFNFENIPSTILDKSYHLTIGGISGEAANQRAHQFNFPIILRVFLKGFRDPAEAIDDALLRGDNILTSAMDTSTRLVGTSIKDVIPSGITVQPLAESNDNAVILEMEFDFKLYECY